MSSESFGPYLRSLRRRRGVSLDRISARTNVSVDLWEALERNDFSGWPRGLYARAYLRDYANILGIDADQVVDEFCRLFPEQGDRRRDTLVRGHADIVGHSFTAGEDMLPPGVKEERRAGPTRARVVPRYSPADLRVMAAILDQAAVLVLAALAAVLSSGGHFWSFAALIALTYHGVSIAWLGCSPCTWAIRTHFSRQPQPGHPDALFSQLSRTIDET